MEIWPLTKDHSPRLRDRFWAVMRRGHYSLCTEKTYWYWIVDFIRFHGMKYSLEPGQKDEVCRTFSNARERVSL